MATSTNRIYYALQHLQINGPSGLNGVVVNQDYDTVHGVQSVGINTNFNVTPVYQLGQQGAYDLFGDIPEHEISVSRIIDGYPCIYGMAMGNAKSMAEAADYRVGLRIYTKDESGTEVLSLAEYLPAYVSNASFNFTVDGDFTEEVTFVSNNSRLYDTTSITPAMALGISAGPETTTPAGQKTAPLLLGRRGTLNLDASNFPGSSASAPENVQSISISFDLGREALNKLGQRAPFTRYISFPVEVTTEITTIDSLNKDVKGSAGQVPDDEQCVDSSVKSDITIKVVLCDGSIFDVGSGNAIQSANTTGGEAGGDNVQTSVTYVSYSSFQYTFPSAANSTMGTNQSSLPAEDFLIPDTIFEDTTAP